MFSRAQSSQNSGAPDNYDNHFKRKGYMTKILVCYGGQGKKTRSEQNTPGIVFGYAQSFHSHSSQLLAAFEKAQSRHHIRCIRQACQIQRQSPRI
jgi:hypothetical protein